MSPTEPTSTHQSDRKLSKVERAKQASDLLRGGVSETLAADDPAFDDGDVQVLKFHGIYQQDDRDERAARRKAGLEKAHQFMVRVRIPGGRLAAAQWLALDDLERRLGQGAGLRLTSRQAVQFHGLTKGDLGPLVAAVDEALLTTLGACGDVGRNVMLSPAPIADAAHELARHVATEIVGRLELETGAYREIWLDGERVRGESERLYGESYLPRKLKLGVTVAGDNEIDVFTQDVGLVVMHDDAARPSLGLLVGGGLGMTHKRSDTFARLASPLGRIDPEEAGAVVEAIAEIFRDHGDRADRRHARLKYLVESWGVERFRERLEARWGKRLEPWIDPGPFGPTARFGLGDQGDGRSYYGLWIENGRLTTENRTRAALRRVATEIGTDFVLTPTQNVLVCDLDRTGLARLETILAEHGVDPPSTLSAARRFAIACPALPTCGLALTDAERVMPEVVAAFETELAALGLGDEPIAIRMTGCPNGCARPYSADVGLVGRAPGLYDVYVGGGLGGDRLGDLWDEKVPREEIVSVLRELLESWRNRRRPGESLGHYYWRHRGSGSVRTLRTGAKEPTRGLWALATEPSEARRSRPALDNRSTSTGDSTMTDTTTTATTPGIPRIGDPAPDFIATTTHGPITFGEWQGDDWVVLFSHPADFTPVCTTELAALARRQDEFERRGAKLIGISIDSVHAHLAWTENIREELGVEIGYPLVADLDQAVARRYGLVHPGEAETATVRALFVIDPARTVRAVIYYPLNVGRNVDEILRLVDALQTAAIHSVATPVDWQPGDDVVVPPPKTVTDVTSRRATDADVHTFYLHTRPLEVPDRGATP